MVVNRDLYRNMNVFDWFCPSTDFILSLWIPFVISLLLIGGTEMIWFLSLWSLFCNEKRQLCDLNWFLDKENVSCCFASVSRWWCFFHQTKESLSRMKSYNINLSIYLHFYQAVILVLTRMHSSRMRTVRSSGRRGSPPGPPGPEAPQPRPPRDQTPPPRTRPPRTRHPLGEDPPPGAGTPQEQTPRYEQNSWYTLVKILPCPKLRLRVVITIIV